MSIRVWKARYLQMVRKAHRVLRHRRLRRIGWWKRITSSLLDRRLWQPCRDTVAGGTSLGLFLSMLPIPFQMGIAALLAARWRVNIPFAIASCWVSNPFTTVPIWIFQEKLGTWMREVLEVPMPHYLTVAHFKMPMDQSFNAASFILGFVTSGIVLSLLAFPIVHLFSAVLPHHLPIRKFPLKRKSAAPPQNSAS